MKNFKAYHKEEKLICEIDVLTDKGAFLIGVKEAEDINYGSLTVLAAENGRFCMFSEITLIRFTELYDIEKNELWEFDVVKTSYGIGKIVFNAGCFMIEWIDDSEAYMELLAFEPKSFGRARTDLVKLGNIFKNPELLKKIKNGNN